MTEADNLRRLLIREVALDHEIVRQDSDPPIGAPTVLACTKVLSRYPTVAQSFFACQPLILLGAESEGGSGAVTEVNTTFLALNLGSTVPPVGTEVLVTFTGSRWVFRYDA